MNAKEGAAFGKISMNEGSSDVSSIRIDGCAIFVN